MDEYTVIGGADHTPAEWQMLAAELARRCPSLGSGQVIGYARLNRELFSVTGLGSDDRREPVPLAALRCCARAIACRYGYREPTLRDARAEYRMRVEGDLVGVARSAYPQPGAVLDFGELRVQLLRAPARHAVVVVDSLAGADVPALVAAGRRAVGASLDLTLAEVVDVGYINVRTYRSGRSGHQAEDTSRGTGVLPAVVASRALGRVAQDEIVVQTCSGPPFVVRGCGREDGQARFWLYRSALHLFDAEAHACATNWRW